jgi:hypothetical protein
VLCERGGDNVPPMKKISRDSILETAYEITRKEGFENINARRIARELNCSVQPIFHNFVNMDELKQAVKDKIYETYKSYLMKGHSEKNSYKGMGLAYIKFAKDYPEFFKLIFMTSVDVPPEKFIVSDCVGDSTIKSGQKFSGLSYEEQTKFHVKIWIFTHGLATLVATKTATFTDEEISRLLGEAASALLEGHKTNEKERK